MSSLLAVVRRALDRGWLLGVAVAVLYFAVAPDVIVDGDNSEFSTLAHFGGAAHPSGYPLYVLWLRAWSWLPVHSPAHAAALATAMLGVASVVVIRAAAIAWGARPAAASLAAAVFATGPVVLHVTTEAEVFALNDLVIATVLWLAAANGPLRGSRRAIALALVAGLGLCAHMTCVLVAPIGILGVVRGIRESPARRIAIAGALAAFAFGLVPYVYLLVAPDSPASWGVVRSFDGLIASITRREYGGVGAFAPGMPGGDLGHNASLLATTLARGWLWLPLVLGLAMLGARSVRRAVADSAAEGQRGSIEPRLGWVLLAVSFVVAGPLLVMRFNLPTAQLFDQMSERFMLVPLLLLVIPVAAAFDRIAALAGPVVARAPAWAGEVGAVVALGLLGAIASLRVAALDSPAVENGIVNTLRSLPENAVLLIASDEQNFGTTYVQQALGVRPDVLVISTAMLSRAWYRERIAARGVVLTSRDPIAIADQLMRAHRAVFVDILIGAVQAAFGTYPYGTVFRVVPTGQPTPTIDEAIAENRELFARFELDEPQPGPADGYATIAHARMQQTWIILDDGLRDDGRADEATKLDAFAAQLGPSP